MKTKLPSPGFTTIKSKCSQDEQTLKLDDKVIVNGKLLKFSKSRMENVIDFVNDVYDWSIERILTTPEILEHPESLKMLVAYRGGNIDPIKGTSPMIERIENANPGIFKDTVTVDSILAVSKDALSKLPVRAEISTEILKDAVFEKPDRLMQLKQSKSVNQNNVGEIILTALKGIEEMKNSMSTRWFGHEIFSTALRLANKHSLNSNDKNVIVKKFLELGSPLCPELKDDKRILLPEDVELVKKSLIENNISLSYEFVPEKLFEDENFCDWFVEKGHIDAFPYLPKGKRSKKRSLQAVERNTANIDHIRKRFIDTKLVSSVFEKGDFFRGCRNLDLIPKKDAEKLLLERLGKPGSRKMFISNPTFFENKEIAKKAIISGILTDEKMGKANINVSLPRNILTDEEIKDAYVKSVIRGTSPFEHTLNLVDRKLVDDGATMHNSLVKAEFSMKRLTDMLFSPKLKVNEYENIFREIKNVISNDYAKSKKRFMRIAAFTTSYFDSYLIDIKRIIKGEEIITTNYSLDFITDMKTHPDQPLSLVFGPLFSMVCPNSKNPYLELMENPPELEDLIYSDTGDGYHALMGARILLSIKTFKALQLPKMLEGMSYYDALLKFATPFVGENKKDVEYLIIKITTFAEIMSGTEGIDGNQWELLKDAVIKSNYLGSFDKIKWIKKIDQTNLVGLPKPQKNKPN